jgi:hypothetical protein
MEWGSFIPMLEKQRSKGLPTALDSMPELPWYMNIWYQYFSTLSYSRTAGMSAYNPIDIPSMIKYSQIIGYDNYEIPRFIRIIQYLDSIFLGHWADKAKKAAK